MNEKHYKETLSEFVNHEVQGDERQKIAEHLLRCADCRKEHDEIKFGAALANQLKQTDAPENLWGKIENALDGKEEKASLIPNFAFFGARGFVSAIAGLLIVFGLIAAIYFGLFRNSAPEIVKNEPDTKSAVNVEIPKVTTTSNEVSTNQKTNSQIAPTVNPNIQNSPKIDNSNVSPVPKIKPIQRENKPKETIQRQNDLPSWEVETLAGMPKIGNSFTSEKLSVGEFLETDANSRARVQVANIGNVEIAPNSRIKFVKTTATEHRLSLEKGELKAKILAPPRLFIVDTPSAVAVDLGCEYTLEVDREGNGKLHVTSGFVALERGGREAIVPAGAIALTKKGKGVGTPFAEDASPEIQKALYEFDFENGGNEALQTIIEKAELYDSITLWHLIARVPRAERGKIFNVLANLIEPPANVTVEGISRLDKKMLDAWWKEIEKVWFE